MSQTLHCCNNRNHSSKSIARAVDEANEWTAHVPFLLSKSPIDPNYALIDVFSMVNMGKHEKILHFHNKCKPSDESSRAMFKRDLQMAFQKNGDHLVSNGHRGNGSESDDKKFVLNCFRHRLDRVVSKENNIVTTDTSIKPCFHSSAKGKPFVRKKQAEKRLPMKSRCQQSSTSGELIELWLKAKSMNAKHHWLSMKIGTMTDSSWQADLETTTMPGTPNLLAKRFNPLPSAVPPEEASVINDLGFAAAPINATQRLMSKRTSLNYSKHARNKLSSSKGNFNV